MYPADHLEAKRDSKRLALELRSRGQAFFTLDLPAIGKALDASLSGGRLAFTRLPGMAGRHKGSPVPRLFWGLWNRLFDRSGTLREDIDPDAVKLLRTLLYAGKKLNVDCKPKRLYEAVKEYFDVDYSLPPSLAPLLWDEPGVHFDSDYLPTLLRAFGGEPDLWSDAASDPAGDAERFVAVKGTRLSRKRGVLGLVACDEVLAHIQRVAGRVGGSLGFFDPDSLQGKHGPGAVSEKPVGRNKYAFPTWSSRLEEFFPWDYHGVTTVDNFLENSLPISDLVPRFEESASKLCAVPKTQKGPRLIASEPVANQWIQQGLASEVTIRISRTLLRHSVTIRDQNPSREDALSASRHGRRATIDLSSASDRLSLRLVECIFRSNISLLKLMASCRTRFLRNPIDKKMPSHLRLRKFASMGSALTFPIQSIVFAVLSLGIGSYLHPRKSLASLAREVRVYGDDIIVPVDWVPLLRVVFSQLGLKVNDSKTFTEGNFRESCGMDAFRGSDVTPAYIRWPTAELNHRSAIGYVACSNNFFLKGFWHTAAYLDEAADWVRKLPVVDASAVVFGRVSFCKGVDPKLKRLWDPATQQEVVKVPVIQYDGKLSASTIENPNGFMEYSVRSRGNDYSWRSLFKRDTGYLPLSTWMELPPDGARAIIRARRVPTRLITALSD